MAKKATRKGSVKLSSRTQEFDTPLFPASGAVDYSGFGFHSDKRRREDRRNRRLEEKNVQRGNYD